MQSILIVISVCLSISLIFSELFSRMKYPRVIGQILAGMFLGLPIFTWLFSPEARSLVTLLSELGIVFLLLLAGMEVNLRKLKKSSRDAFLISIAGALIPFGLGYLLAQYLTYSHLESLVLGAALALTAEGTNLKVLIETNLLNTKVGSVILGAGIIDDVFEVLFLASILFVINQVVASIAVFPVLILSFTLLVFFILRYTPKLITYVHKEHSATARFSTMLVIALLIVSTSIVFGLGEILGAFIAGLIIQITNKYKQEEHEIVSELQVMSFSFVVPFFFINIGLHFDPITIIANWELTLLVILVGLLGKLGGALLMVPFTSLTWSQGWVIGWGMNSRGAVELVIAELARSSGMITNELYSAIIAMAVITTLMFPFALRWIVSKHPHIMTETKRVKVHHKRKHKAFT